MIVDEMKAALREAMIRRDSVAVSALRTALGAIANAEAAPIDSAPLEVRGELVEHDRVELTEAEVARIVAEQIADREHTIGEIAGRGQEVESARLAGEIDALRTFADRS